MRAPSIIAVCIVSMTVVLTGCAKKPAKSAPLPPAPAPIESPAPPAAPPEPEVPPAPVANPLDGDLDSVNRYVYEQGLIGDVYYDYDRDEIRGEARSRLLQNAEFMKAHEQFVFEVEGHCDERGSIGYNVALGDRRASAAKNYVSSLGVADGRMQTVTYGKERPVCTESNESCWSRNRRAHFVITGRR
jgi:peptidoglycan-associated lipoprotein